MKRVFLNIFDIFDNKKEIRNYLILALLVLLFSYLYQKYNRLLPLKYQIQGLFAIVLVYLILIRSITISFLLLTSVISFQYYLHINSLPYLEVNVVLVFFIFFLVFIRKTTDRSKLIHFFKHDYTKYIRYIVFIVFISYFVSLINPSQIDFPESERGASIIGLSNLFSAVLVFYFAINFIKSKKILTYVLYLLVLASLYHYFLVYVTVINPPLLKFLPTFLISDVIKTEISTVGNIYRVGGKIGGYGLFGEYLAIILILILYLLNMAKSYSIKFTLAFLLLLTLLFLVSTGTRMSILAFGIGLLFWGCLSAIYQRKPTKFLQVFVGLVFIFIILMQLNNYSRKLKTGVAMDRIMTYGLVISRMDDGTWPNIIPEIIKQPIIGHGPARPFYIGEMKTSSHNLYLSLLYQYGVLGLIGFLIFFIKLIKTNHKISMKYFRNEFPYNLPLCLNICIIIFLVDELVREYAISAAMQHFIWLIFGISVATWNLIEKEKEKLANNDDLEGTLSWQK